MCAPDVYEGAFEYGNEAWELSQMASNVHVYFAKDDWVFQHGASKMRQAGHPLRRRMGQHGPRNLQIIPNIIKAINATKCNFNSILGHSYYCPQRKSPRSRAVFNHIAQTIETGMSPMTGRGARTMTLDPYYMGDAADIQQGGVYLE